MSTPATTMNVSLLQQSLITHDPMEFVLLEGMLRTHTMARVPQWSPRLILSPGGWGRYKRGRDHVDQIEVLIDQMWLQLVEGILKARNDYVHHQAQAQMRRLQWAEDLRKQQDQLDQQLGYQEKLAEIQDRMASLADKRALTQDLAVTKINHIYTKEITALQLNQHDPAYKADRYRAAMELIKPELDAIAAAPHTNAVKNQLSRAYLDALKLILQ